MPTCFREHIVCRFDQKIYTGAYLCAWAEHWQAKDDLFSPEARYLYAKYFAQEPNRQKYLQNCYRLRVLPISKTGACRITLLPAGPVELGTQESLPLWRVCHPAFGPGPCLVEGNSLAEIIRDAQVRVPLAALTATSKCVVYLPREEKRIIIREMDVQGRPLSRLLGPLTDISEQLYAHAPRLQIGDKARVIMPNALDGLYLFAEETPTDFIFESSFVNQTRSDVEAATETTSLFGQLG